MKISQYNFWNELKAVAVSLCFLIQSILYNVCQVADKCEEGLKGLLRKQFWSDLRLAQKNYVGQMVVNVGDCGPTYHIISYVCWEDTDNIPLSFFLDFNIIFACNKKNGNIDRLTLNRYLFKNLKFHPPEVVSGYRNSQFQVGEITHICLIWD